MSKQKRKSNQNRGCSGCLSTVFAGLILLSLIALALDKALSVLMSFINEHKISVIILVSIIILFFLLAFRARKKIYTQFGAFEPIYFEEDLCSVDRMKGTEFEHWCAELLRNVGYKNILITPGSGDQGADIIAEKGGKKYAFQCKRYSSNLGNTPVQEVLGGMLIYNCDIGVVITNQYFTDGAKQLASKANVWLIDRTGILEMMREANEIKKCFDIVSKKEKPQEIVNEKHDEEGDDEPINMDGYIKMRPMIPDKAPYECGIENIVSIVSDPFKTEKDAEHFAEVISKHCHVEANIKKEEDGERYLVIVKARVYSIMSYYRDGYYTFANWA